METEEEMGATRGIAILGGTGFIGLHLTRRLLRLPDVHITLVDNLSRGKLDAEVEALLASNSSVQFVEADLTDRSAVEGLGSGFDEVYLLAGMVGVRITQEAPDRVAFVNAMIVLNVLEWLKAVPSTRLVYASTSEAYAGAIGLGGHFHVPTDEDVLVAIDDVRNPRSTYAASKILGECAVMAHHQVHGLHAAVVRYHNVYGPRMGYEHVIPELSVRLLQGNDPCDVYGWDQTRAFCYVDDAVEGTMAVMAADQAAGEIFHIGTDLETPIAELAGALWRPR
jgi:UDP-glucose 4-epimerase